MAHPDHEAGSGTRMDLQGVEQQLENLENGQARANRHLERLDSSVP
jgi:hypothetical protein